MHRNILLLEDEQRAGEKLLDLIREVAPTATVEWIRSVDEGIAFLQTAPQPAVIFADIELLDGAVFRIFETVQPACPIIFCTAYDAYYAAAFQANGIAYLLKPYTNAQFQEAWTKYVSLFEKNQQTAVPPAFWESLQALIPPQKQAYKSTFPVKRREGVFLLKTKDVAYFQAQGDFVIAFDASGGKHLLSYPLAEIESLIDPATFFRINRSEIVHIESILKFTPYSKNKLALTLSAPAATLYTAGSRTPDFRRWIENQ